MSPDSPDTAVDGVRLTELVEQLPLSRSSVFELLKVLKIKTTTGPGPTGKGRVAWISTADSETIAAAAARVAKKEIRIADLATGLQRRQTPQTAMAAASAGSPESADPGTFLARLDAADKAIRSGLGLTTTEAAWILGVKPGAGVVTRGGIRATRTGWNCWRLESADSPAMSGNATRLFAPH
jgi:hypothetical protein